MYLKFIIIIFFLLEYSLTGQSIRINEFLASNYVTNPEMHDFDDFSDWIEIYNRDSIDQDLSNHFLTDDLDTPLKWKIPENTIIEANSYLLFWADGFNERPNVLHTRPYWPWDDFITKNYHTNFKLSKEGEEIGLFKAEQADSLTFIQKGDSWKYYDSGIYPDVNWMNLDFYDADWSAGYAELGYGDGDEATIVDFGPDSDEKYITTYFRKVINVDNSDGLQSLRFKVLRDDGVLVYLNGNEIIRDNMPIGEISFQTQAISTVSFSNEEKFYEWYIDADLIHEGENVVAVEVHQSSSSSSDKSFDLELKAFYFGVVNLIDSVSFGEQISDVSYGRNHQSEIWGYYGRPTPGFSNDIYQLQIPLTSGEVNSNLESGVYNNSQAIILSSTNQESIIYYTIDGSKPVLNSNIYTSPILINSNTIVRSRAIEPNKLPGKISTYTYFISSQNSIPIMSLIVEPDFLWGDDIGIYSNEYKQREIPVTIHYIEDGINTSYEIDAGARLGGLNIWIKPQKPFTIYTRGRFGEDAIYYQLFENKPIANFSRIVLRNGGDDWEETLIRDPMIESIANGMMDCGYMAYTPSSLYLNGDYWGIYNIREKFDKNYFTQNFNVNGDNIDHLEYTETLSGVELLVVEGDLIDYNAMINIMSSSNISNANGWILIDSLLNVNSFIDHVFLTAYAANTSWEHNREWWKEKSNGSKWQWLIVDLDRGFNYSNIFRNLIDNLIEDYELFGLLLENQVFKEKFAQRSAAHLNSTFAPSRIENIVDSLSNVINSEIINHIEKWSETGGIESYDEWVDELLEIKEFAMDRSDFVFEQIDEELNLYGTLNLNISVTPQNSGKVLVNDVNSNYQNNEAKYFKDIPIELAAIPNPGYEFIGWEGISDSSYISMSFNDNSTLTALFQLSNDIILPDTLFENVNLSDQSYVVLNDLVIKQGITLSLSEGTLIKMPPEGNIIVNGRLLISGTNDNPVTIINSNTSVNGYRWGAICFNNVSDTSKIDNLHLSGASRGVDPTYQYGAISGKDANLIIKNTLIEDVLFPIYINGGSIDLRDNDIYCEFTCDFINVKNGTAYIKGNTFFGSNAIDTDAIDLDGVTNGIVNGNRIYNFIGFNSDGIDIGEMSSNILIENNLIYNSGDKGVSVGQGSTVTLKSNVIVGSKVGIAVKDNSTADVIKNTFFRNDTSISAFEKNSGLGGGIIHVKNTLMYQRLGNPIYKDELSNISVNYSLSNTEIISGQGNILDDPQFIDKEYYNLELMPNSPCINSGDPSLQLDNDGTISDIGGYYTFNDLDYPFDVPQYLADHIKINELLAINSTTNQDEFGEFDDWVEIFNSSSESMDLSNCFLSDDVTDLTKWRFPDSASIIPSEGYLLIWCDDNSVQGNLHANFKLSSSGETLTLSTNDGFTIIDQITFDQQNSDLSYGREIDGFAAWTFGSPSPNAPNGSLSTNQDKTVLNNFKLLSNYPNPFNPTTNINYFTLEDGYTTLVIHDITGREIKLLVNTFQKSGYKSVAWNGTNNLNQPVSAGMYFYTIQAKSFTQTKKMLLLK